MIFRSYQNSVEEDNLMRKSHFHEELVLQKKKKRIKPQTFSPGEKNFF